MHPYEHADHGEPASEAEVLRLRLAILERRAENAEERARAAEARLAEVLRDAARSSTPPRDVGPGSLAPEPGDLIRLEGVL